MQIITINLNDAAKIIEPFQYILVLLCATMIIDFIVGTVKAKVTNTWISKKGINGILRKGCSILVMILLAFLSVLIPGNMGVSLVYVLYVGYELNEFQSILENLDGMGVNVQPILKYFGTFEKIIEEENEKKINNKGVK